MAEDFQPFGYSYDLNQNNDLEPKLDIDRGLRADIPIKKSTLSLSENSSYRMKDEGIKNLEFRTKSGGMVTIPAKADVDFDPAKISPKLKNFLGAVASDLGSDNLPFDLVITSGMEGKHADNSLHYLGQAVDIRIAPKFRGTKAGETPWDDPMYKYFVEGHGKDLLQEYGMSMLDDLTHSGLGSAHIHIEEGSGKFKGSGQPTDSPIDISTPDQDIINPNSEQDFVTEVNNASVEAERQKKEEEENAALQELLAKQKKREMLIGMVDSYVANANTELPQEEQMQATDAYRPRPVVTTQFQTLEQAVGLPEFEDGGEKKPFEEWYKTVPKEKADTSMYNLRRAYELAPQEELDAFVNSKEAHLRTAYPNSEGVYEFVKSKNHPTIQKELDWYNSEQGADFRADFDLDKSGEYFRYVPRRKMQNGGEHDPSMASINEVLLQRNKDVPFVKRIADPTTLPSLDRGEGEYSTHSMAADVDENGQWYVYPTVVEQDGKLVDMGDAAFDNALATQNFIKAPSAKVAIDLSENYKYTNFAHDSFKEFEDGGMYEDVDEGIIEYKEGGVVYRGERFSGYNKPKRTSSHPSKSHAVLARENDKIKLIRFGQQGVSGAGKSPKTDKEKARRKSFKARHAKNIKKGKMSAAYWANKVKWEHGGEHDPPYKVVKSKDDPAYKEYKAKLNNYIYSKKMNNILVEGLVKEVGKHSPEATEKMRESYRKMLIEPLYTGKSSDIEDEYVYTTISNPSELKKWQRDWFNYTPTEYLHGSFDPQDEKLFLKYRGKIDKNYPPILANHVPELPATFLYEKPKEPVFIEGSEEAENVEKQYKLKQAGLYKGKLDGIWGSKSEKAWEEYSKSNTEKEETKTPTNKEMLKKAIEAKEYEGKERIVPEMVYRGVDRDGNPIYEEKLSRERYEDGGEYEEKHTNRLFGQGEKFVTKSPYGKHVEKWKYDPITKRYVYKEKDVTYADGDNERMVYKQKELGSRDRNYIHEKKKEGRGKWEHNVSEWEDGGRVEKNYTTHNGVRRGEKDIYKTNLFGADVHKHIDYDNGEKIIIKDKILDNKKVHTEKSKGHYSREVEKTNKSGDSTKTIFSAEKSPMSFEEWDIEESLPIDKYGNVAYLRRHDDGTVSYNKPWMSDLSTNLTPEERQSYMDNPDVIPMTKEDYFDIYYKNNDSKWKLNQTKTTFTNEGGLERTNKSYNPFLDGFSKKKTVVTKFEDGGETDGIIKDKGYEYKRDGNNFYTRKEGSKDWVQASGIARDAIAAKVYNDPIAPERISTDELVALERGLTGDEYRKQQLLADENQRTVADKEAEQFAGKTLPDWKAKGFDNPDDYYNWLQTDELGTDVASYYAGLAEFTGVPSAIRIYNDPMGTIKGVGNTIADLAYASNTPMGMGVNTTNPFTGNEMWSGVGQTMDVLGVLPAVGAVGKGAKALKPIITRGAKKITPLIQSTAGKNARIDRFLDKNTVFSNKVLKKDFDEAFVNQPTKWKPVEGQMGRFRILDENTDELVGHQILDGNVMMSLQKHPLNDTYYFGATSNNPLAAGRAFKELEQKLPAYGKINEPKSLSLDSYTMLLNQVKKGKDFTNKPAGYIPLNYSAKQNKALDAMLMGMEAPSYHPFTKNQALTAADEVNLLLKQKGITDRKAFIDKLGGQYGVRIPNYELTRKYEDGGELNPPPGVDINIGNKTIHLGFGDMRNILGMGVGAGVLKNTMNDIVDPPTKRKLVSYDEEGNRVVDVFYEEGHPKHGTYYKHKDKDGTIKIKNNNNQH